ncbi:DUF4328 domain-containing protein [Actinopolymorpha alba]|uniref:DUF4328 domain-containing protein n=1 Tax=Actinopolymorpha alba TaxID=533267 RepID=UPI0003A4AEAB|nr:DUF4328 domain-containing protein [Actinopolymorpha alba]
MVEPAKVVALKPVRSLGNALRVLLGVSIAVGVVGGVTSGLVAMSLSDYDSTAPYGSIPLTTTESVQAVAGIAWYLPFLGCAITFIVWLFRTRHNAEVLCAAQHRRARGWLIAGWIVPVVNLWFPKQVVDDIWSASDPRTPAVRRTFDGLARSGLVTAWWMSWIVWLFLNNIVSRMALRGETVSDQQLASVVASASVVPLLLAGVLAMVVVGRITQFQESRGSETGAPSTVASPAVQQ